MNAMTICKRCGWRCNSAEPAFVEIEGEARLIQAPPDLSAPHPIDKCNSPFWRGQGLYWDLDWSHPDTPPLRVIFQELTEIESPVYVYDNGNWVKETDAKASVASVLVDQDMVLPEHVEIYGEKLLSGPIEVLVSHLLPEERWPVIEI